MTEIFGLRLQPYGTAVAVGALLSLLVSAFVYKRKAISAKAHAMQALLTVLLGVLCARIGFCLADFEYVSEIGFFSFLFDFTQGGFLLYGALAGGMLAAWITSVWTKVDFLKLTDAAAPSAALMIACARAAEGLADVGYGWNVRQWFEEDSGMSLFALDDPGLFGKFPFAVADYYGSAKFAVFMLEALIGLLIFVFLITRKERQNGSLSVQFLALYASTQVLMESMRQDAVLRFGFVRINQVLGAILIAALVWYCVKRYRLGSQAVIRSAVLIAVAVVLVMAMEFALEHKISMLEWMTLDLCYVVSALGCLCLYLAVLLPLRQGIRGKMI